MSKLADMLRRGPFVNEDGDVYVPVTVGGIGRASKIAGEQGERVRFVDMGEFTYSMHEWISDAALEGEPEHLDDCEFKDDQPCTWTARGYHFRVVE